MLTFPTPQGGNHPLWVLGHLAWAEGRMMQQVMLGQPDPLAHWRSLFGIGSEASAEAERYPAFEEVLPAFHDLRAGTWKVLETLSDDDLDRPSQACPPDWQGSQGTCADCFRVVIFNTMHHRGQVADARRVRAIKVFDAPLVEIIDRTGAVSTPSTKLVRNRRFRGD